MRKKIVPRGQLSAAGYNSVVDTANAALPASQSPGDKSVATGWGSVGQFTEVNPLRICKITGTNETGYGFIEQVDIDGSGTYIDSPYGIVGSLDSGISLRTLPGITLFEGCIVVARQNPNFAFRYEMISEIACPEEGGSGGSGDTPYVDRCTGEVYSIIRYRYACVSNVLSQTTWVETLTYDSTGCLVLESSEEITTEIGCCGGDAEGGCGGSGGSGGSSGGTIDTECCPGLPLPETLYVTISGSVGTFPMVWNGISWSFSGMICGFTISFEFACGIAVKVFTLTSDTGMLSFDPLSYTRSCDPFSISTTGTFSGGTSCDGAHTFTVTI